jgi:hypothetical protein
MAHMKLPGSYVAVEVCLTIYHGQCIIDWVVDADASGNEVIIR